jgi:polar amino acid transport system substrate-binding protein
MRMGAIILAALLARICALAHAQAVPALTITTENSAPYSMRAGGRVTGIATDIVREIMARAGIAYSIELLPWKRAYMSALERRDGCVYSTSRTPEREAQFKWVGPVAEADWVFLARADSKLKLRSLEEARPYRIGTYHGDARDQYLRSRGFNVDPAQNDLINPRKLALGRIDVWAASVPHGGKALERLAESYGLKPLLVFNRMRVYLACNPAVPDGVVNRLNVALEGMERDGTVRTILRRYEDMETATP